MSGAKKKAERKAQEALQPKKKVYNLTEDDIERIKRDATNEAMNKAYVLMLGIPAMTLRDYFGYGSVRLERFTDGCFDYYDSFQKGYITLQDCIDCLKDECGISIEEKAKQRRLF